MGRVKTALGFGVGLPLVAVVFSIFWREQSSLQPPTAGAPTPLATCLKQNLIYPDWKPASTAPLPNPIVIHDVEIWTGNGNVLKGYDVLLQDGKIKQLSATTITPPADATEINANGRILTPGIVDIHSHAGLGTFPTSKAMYELDESTSPAVPYVRAIDTFHPEDLAIPQLLNGGVTTSQVLPGSDTVMGGEGFIFKSKVAPNVVPRTRDLLISNCPRILKMACGENPRTTFGAGRGMTPETRMGSAWLMRDQFQEAAELVASQNSWCSSSSTNTTSFPNDLRLQSLAQLLRGDVVLNVHCYLVEDMEMVLRLSQEFGFRVNTFQHALEAWKVPDLLLQNNITVAIFLDHWAMKVEAYDSTVYAAAQLAAKGVKIAIKSDHPILHAKDLVFQAARAVYYGMPPQAALTSITSTPAAALGLSDRLGIIREGFDADVVVWDRDPFALGATPWKVIIDGQVFVDNSQAPPRPFPYTPKPTSPLGPVQAINNQQLCNTTTNQPVSLACYAVTNAGNIYTQDPAQGSLSGANVVVQGGVITCVGLPADCVVPVNCQEFNLLGGGGVVIPGLVESLAHIAQVEIAKEPSVNDGQITGSGTNAQQAAVGVSLLDGVRATSSHLQSAWRGGVTTAVATPIGFPVVGTPSAALATCCGQTADDLLIASDVAIHLSFGNNARAEGLTATISGQFAAVRTLLTQAQAAPPNVTSTPTSTLAALAKAVRGEMPVVISANQIDILGGVLKLKEQFPLLQIVIVGGAEGAGLASRLAANNITVLLPYRQLFPRDFETLLYTDDTIAKYAAAGVQVGLCTLDFDTARNLRWEAGVVSEWIGWDLALAGVTSVVADSLRLPWGTGRIITGTRANFAFYTGDPLSLWSVPAVVASGSNVQCSPQQR